MPTDIMIEARNLSKFYGRFKAVENFSFSIKKGEIVAFLGPNGAGKSTTMKLLTGYVSSTGGEAFLGGYDISVDRLKAAEILGYLPENGPLYLDNTPLESLRFTAEIRGFSKKKMNEEINRVVELCDLDEVINKACGKLSKGYRQRVGMAQALLHDPEILILDEPTSGLDPNQIRKVRDTLKEIGKEKTILLSTHILQEVEAIADRVIFISEGKLRFDGTLEEFRKQSDTLDQTFHKLSKEV